MCLHAVQFVFVILHVHAHVSILRMECMQFGLPVGTGNNK